ncbi:MAG: hypothetical protein ACAH07_12170 [Methylophilaceae bacterium]|jgi:hypothetical protein|nr:hypothetical protein [Methyloradius sp.]
MTTLQNSIIKYLIDYQQITTFNAHQLEKQGRLLRCEGMKQRAACIAHALKDYETECKLAN